MNTLTYSGQGHARWRVRMPTFLVDGEDLIDKLGVAGLALAGIAGVGLVPEETFQYPTVRVFHEVPEGTECRQVILDVHLGDTWGDFVTAVVSRRAGTITWSQFESCPGVRTPLLPVGPFVFRVEQYREVLAPVCVVAFRPLQKCWTVPEDALQATWASGWSEPSAPPGSAPKTPLHPGL